MKILKIITGLGQGGAERIVCDLADSMYDRGHEVKIVYLVGEVLIKPRNEEIEIIPLNLSKLSRLPKSYFKLVRLIKVYQPDIIHSHMIHANLLSRLVRLTTPINKLINTAHSNNEGGWHRMMLYRLTYNLADINTHVSRNAALSFEFKKAVPKNGMITIYNGINLQNFHHHKLARLNLQEALNISQDNKILLAVGRFHEYKDYPNLLKAIKLLIRSELSNFKLLIAGDGELRSELEELIVEHNLQNHIILLGRRKDIPQLMSAADLFILPSKYEGFGLVVAEAMACECLVVATDCGGVAEVLNNSNFLVPPSNALELACKIKYALELPLAQRKDVIDKNLAHVKQNFSLESIVDKWLTIYGK